MTDIRTDPDVLRVYWEMKGVTEWMHNEALCKIPDSKFDYRWMCSKCREDSDDIDTENCPIPDPITDDVWTVAGFMRDQCVEKCRTEWRKAKWQVYTEVVDKYNPNSFHDFSSQWFADEATPEQWIEASVRAWGAK